MVFNDEILGASGHCAVSVVAFAGSLALNHARCFTQTLWHTGVFRHTEHTRTMTSRTRVVRRRAARGYHMPIAVRRAQPQDSGEHGREPSHARSHTDRPTPPRARGGRASRVPATADAPTENGESHYTQRSSVSNYLPGTTHALPRPHTSPRPSHKSQIFSPEARAHRRQPARSGPPNMLPSSCVESCAPKSASMSLTTTPQKAAACSL